MLTMHLAGGWLHLDSQARKPRSTITHDTVYVPQRDTNALLQVRNVGPLDKVAHLRQMRGHLDKMKKFAMEKFGY